MKMVEKINIMLTTLSILIILSFLWNYIVASYYTGISLCVLLIIGFLGIYYVERRAKYKIPEKTKFVYLFFLFAAAVMGSLVNLYASIPIYDTIMHFISGILATYIAVLIFKHYNKYNNYNIIYILIFVFSFNLAIAAIWEMMEYTIDIMLNLDTQKVKLYGIDDTMQDIIAALAGGILFIIIYHKRKKLI